MCVCEFKNYTIRLLLIQHDMYAEDSKSSLRFKDGCLLVAIAAAAGAAVVLTLTIIVATTVFIHHRRPSFTNRRVRVALFLELVKLFHIDEMMNDGMICMMKRFRDIFIQTIFSLLAHWIEIS